MAHIETGDIVRDVNDPRPFPLYGRVTEISETVTVLWHDDFNGSTFTTDDNTPEDLAVVITARDNGPLLSSTARGDNPVASSDYF